MESAKYFEATQSAIEAFRELDGVLQYEISDGKTTQKWAMDFTTMSIIKGGVDDPICTISVSDKDFIALLKGEADGTELFMSGKMKLDGDMSFAMGFTSAMELMKGINPQELYGKSKL
eukprot:225250_1